MTSWMIPPANFVSAINRTSNGLTCWDDVVSVVDAGIEHIYPGAQFIKDVQEEKIPY